MLLVREWEVEQGGARVVSWFCWTLESRGEVPGTRGGRDTGVVEEE